MMRERCAITRAMIYDINQVHFGLVEMANSIETHLCSPFDELRLVGLNQSCNHDTQLITPGIPFLDLNVRWKSRVFDGLLLFFGFLFGCQARVLFPMTAVLREESLLMGISDWASLR